MELRSDRWRLWVPVPLSLLEDFLILAAVTGSLWTRFFALRGLLPLPAVKGLSLYRVGMGFLREIRDAGPEVWLRIQVAKDRIHLAVRTL
ncbi:MAG: hypothetical protein QJR00_01385 [Bacillota bacterium]|nr:hypothetical protein [Bacillota bacterium]